MFELVAVQNFIEMSCDSIVSTLSFSGQPVNESNHRTVRMYSSFRKYVKFHVFQYTSLYGTWLNDYDAQSMSVKDFDPMICVSSIVGTTSRLPRNEQATHYSLSIYHVCIYHFGRLINTFTQVHTLALMTNACVCIAAVQDSEIEN